MQLEFRSEVFVEHYLLIIVVSEYHLYRWVSRFLQWHGMQPISVPPILFQVPLLRGGPEALQELAGEAKNRPGV